MNDMQYKEQQVTIKLELTANYYNLMPNEPTPNANKLSHALHVTTLNQSQSFSGMFCTKLAA